MTSPRTPLGDALRELIRVSKGAGMNAVSDFGYMPSQQQADEEEISEAVQAVYAAVVADSYPSQIVGGQARFGGHVEGSATPDQGKGEPR